MNKEGCHTPTAPFSVLTAPAVPKILKDGGVPCLGQDVEERPKHPHRGEVLRCVKAHSEHSCPLPQRADHHLILRGPKY